MHSKAPQPSYNFFYVKHNFLETKCILVSVNRSFQTAYDPHTVHWAIPWWKKMLPHVFFSLRMIIAPGCYDCLKHFTLLIKFTYSHQSYTLVEETAFVGEGDYQFLLPHSYLCTQREFKVLGFVFKDNLWCVYWSRDWTPDLLIEKMPLNH